MKPGSGGVRVSADEVKAGGFGSTPAGVLPHRRSRRLGPEPET